MPSIDRLRQSDPALIGISNGPCIVVTPHDSTNFTDPVRYLLITSTGNVALVNLDDSVTVIQNIAAGTYIMCAAKRINSTSTTVAAGNIIGFP